MLGLLPELSTEGPFDFAFIDTEKEGRPAYLDWVPENLNRGNIIAGHNALGPGDVVYAVDTSERTKALRGSTAASPRIRDLSARFFLPGTVWASP